MYVLVRSNLSKSQQAVQAGHCVAQHLIDNQTEWTNGTLVYLKVPSEKVLINYYNYLFDNGYECSCFREPDIGNELTSVSCLGHGEMFKSLKLL